MPLFSSLPPFVNDLLQSVSEVWGWTWWIVLPFLSFFIFWENWLYYIRVHYADSINWKLFEIKVPKNILKTPKSMEQIFAAAHAPYSYGLLWREQYWQGKMEDLMTFELVSNGGEMRFFMRVSESNRNLMEAAIYAQYPDAEIRETKDYLDDLPSVLPNKTYDLYGVDFELREPSPLPIRTYPLFEEAVEERRVDPIAGIMEVMSKLKADERLWMQILIRPAGEDWKAQGRALIDKIIGRDKKKGPGFFESIFGVTASEVVRAPFEHPSLEPKKRSENGENFRMLLLSPGEKEMIDAIEQKISKLGFEATVRLIYIDKRESFSRSNMMAVFGAFRQFHIQNLNSMRPDKTATTYMKKGFLRTRRLEWRKRVIFDRYRYLISKPQASIFNTEELATIFHFPTLSVAAPQLQRIESKKGGAPPTLPIIE